jgi:hypothetical protein
MAGIFLVFSKFMVLSSVTAVLGELGVVGIIGVSIYGWKNKIPFEEVYNKSIFRGNPKVVYFIAGIIVIIRLVVSILTLFK